MKESLYMRVRRGCEALLAGNPKAQLFAIPEFEAALDVVAALGGEGFVFLADYDAGASVLTIHRVAKGPVTASAKGGGRP